MVFKVYTRPSELIGMKKGTVYIYRHPSRVVYPIEVAIIGEEKICGAFFEMDRAQEYADYLVDKPK